MTAENFDADLEALLFKQPFSAFMVEMIDGKRVEIDIPNSVATRTGIAVFVAAGGHFTIIECNRVLRFISDPSTAA